MKEPKAVHIVSEKNLVAPIIAFLVGDPNRAKYLAKKFLVDAKLFNKVRGELGYIGKYKGYKILIMSCGMGRASWRIYIEELTRFFGVKILIRLGTCGAYGEDMELGDVVIPRFAYSDDTVEMLADHFQNLGIAPDTKLFTYAQDAARKLEAPYFCGSVLATDYFYAKPGHEDDWKKWHKAGIIAVDMESDVLFELGKRLKKDGVRTASLLTVSDNLCTGKNMTPGDRTKSSDMMFHIAVDMISKV